MHEGALQICESRVSEARKHVLFQHNDADGYICMAKKDKRTGRFTQYHYKPEELAKVLSNYTGDDIFFSQNTFYRPQRAIETVRQLKSLYVDLDFYIFNYDPNWIIGKLESEYYRKKIPEPNLIIFSGQGIVLIWLIEPVPFQALPLWQAVQDFLLMQLKSLGGDPKANDAARVFRIAGSTNSKNGADVRVEYRSAYRHVLRDIQFDYLPELTPKPQAPGTKKKAGRKKKIVHLFNVYTLNQARAADLHRLVKMRGYDVEGYRETILFLYRYWTACFRGNAQDALEQTLDFNSTFISPLPENEVIRATRSAEKAYEASSNAEANRVAIEKGYPGAGYNISNAKLISWLDITAEEMMGLKTIISTKEKRRRDYEKKIEQRRADGMKERAVYLAEEKEKTESSLQILRDILKENPNLSIRKLAELSGLSKTHVGRLKKLI